MKLHATPQNWYKAVVDIVDISVKRLRAAKPYEYLIIHLDAPSPIIVRIRNTLDMLHFPYQSRGNRIRVLKRHLDVWLGSEKYKEYLSYRKKIL